jgi:sugar/nucleoside kinase (ribokinase family)
VNEDEMHMMAPDPLGLAAVAMAAGIRCLTVTMGKRGVVYFAAPGFDALADLERGQLSGSSGPIRTELLPAMASREPDAADPTGCGDVWGATYFSRLLAGDDIAESMRVALVAAAKNVDHRGATGLSRYLRGELSVK